MADQFAIGAGNIQTLVKSSPYAHIEINQRRTAQLLAPDFRPLTNQARRSDMDLLLARSALTGFIGRQEVWNDCLAWCHAPDTVSIRCITGPSGSGKTRLALELVHHLRALADWDARFVEFFILEPFDLWAKTDGQNHVLLVFDQAGDVIDTLAPSLQLLANEAPRNTQRKLRVLLLARHANWDEGWLSALQPRSAIQESVRDRFDPDQPIRLGPLPEADCLALYTQAMQAAAVLTNLPQPHDPPPDIFARSRMREALRDPLSLIMAAVTAVRCAVPDPFALTRLELAYELAASLARSMDGAFSENPQLAHHMAAYITLSSGLSRDQTQDALDVEAHSNSLGVVLNPGGFVDRLRTWLPGDKTADDRVLGTSGVLIRDNRTSPHGRSTWLGQLEW